MEASTTRKPTVFFTVRSGFVTPNPSVNLEVYAVPVACRMEFPNCRIYSSVPALVVVLTAVMNGSRIYPCQGEVARKDFIALTPAMKTSRSTLLDRYAGLTTGWSKADEVAKETEPARIS